MRILVLFQVVLLLGVGSSHARGGDHFAVSSAHPDATQAGVAVAKKGGNAVDVAVAVSLALSVVEPYSSGLGGGAFMVIRMGSKTTTWDFRETAPAAATRDMFLKKGRVVRGRSTVSALAAGIPGLVRGLSVVHKKYGKLPWQDVVNPAFHLAHGGFKITPRLRGAIQGAVAKMNRDARRVFLVGGQAPAVGHRLRQPDLAWTLKRIRDRGADDFYQGDVATRLVRAVRTQGGIWTLQDLKQYRVKERPPVRGMYRGYQIHSMGPPSSGGLLLVQMLHVLEGLGSDAVMKAGIGRTHQISEIMKRAFARRAKDLGDPDHVKVDWSRFVGAPEVKKIVGQVRAARKATPAQRIGRVKVRPSERTDTSHFSVLMGNGNAVSCTQTINLRFGNGKIAGTTGVVLNNEMDDFSAKPGAPNAFGLVGDEANAIAPGKRPLSSMTPSLVIRDGKAVGVFGSPGGSRIITTVLHAILNVIDRKMSVKAALTEPRFHHQWFPDAIFLEAGIAGTVRDGLRRLGHQVKAASPMGNAMGIWRDPAGKISAAADPRGEGKAVVR